MRSAGLVWAARAGWSSTGRRLALVSRREASEEALKTIEQLEKAGVSVKLLSADVTCEERVEEVLAEDQRTMPPLRGIVHAAGALDDGMVHKQTWEQFERVLGTQVRAHGSRTASFVYTPLDFFVLFSSAASMFGSAGQANHAAANAFLDALGAPAQGAGVAGVERQLGGVVGGGRGGRAPRLGKAFAERHRRYQPQQGWRALEMVFKHSRAQVACAIRMNWKQRTRLCERTDAAARSRSR